MAHHHHGGRVDLNRASRDEIARIEGFDETLADKVIEARERLGGIRGREDLLKIEGVDETRARQLMEGSNLGESGGGGGRGGEERSRGGGGERQGGGERGSQSRNR